MPGIRGACEFTYNGVSRIRYVALLEVSAHGRRGSRCLGQRAACAQGAAGSAPESADEKTAGPGRSASHLPDEPDRTGILAQAGDRRTWRGDGHLPAVAADASLSRAAAGEGT